MQGVHTHCMAARVAEGVAMRPCGRGWISISSIWLEVALDVQAELGLKIKIRWGREECKS